MNDVFIPDFDLLLLCDSVIIDETSFKNLMSRSMPIYSEMADTLDALKADGRVEMKDFSSLLISQSDLLDRMVDQDIKFLDNWVTPLRNSLSLWRSFSKTSVEIDSHFGNTMKGQLKIFHEIPWENDKIELALAALESSEKRKRRKYRSPLRDMLRIYLNYVNANLIISHQLGVGFHDWLDFMPFYEMKFLFVGEDGSSIEKNRYQLKQLFTIPFPNLAIRNPRSLIKALNDRRIEDLRALVNQAARGEIKLDNEFAKSVLIEVLDGVRGAKKWRNIIGYASLPIGFIPWIGTPAQKLVEEGVGRQIDNKFMEKHRWFYMLSEIAGIEKEKPNPALDLTLLP
jgi:hypothetical protein